MANQVSGMAGYLYYRSTDGGATFTQLNSTPLPEGTSFEVLNLDPDTDYAGQLYWAPVDKNGNVGAKKSYAADGLTVRTLNPTPADAPMATDKVNAIKAIVAQCIAAGAGPGVSLRIRGPMGHVELDFGSGTGQSLHYRIASQTKSMTATIILMQLDRGLLSLDDHPSKYLGSTFANSDVMTLRQMLMMRSGIFDYTLAAPGLLGMLGLNLGAQYTLNPTMAYTVDQIIADIKAGAALSTPGSTYYYTNSNFYMLAKIAEAVDPAHRTIDQIMQQDLWGPLGMANTYMQLATGTPAAPYSPGYDNNPVAAMLGIVQKRDVSSQNPAFIWASGAVVSVLPDMMKWCQELRDGTLLSPETHQLRQNTFGMIPLAGQARYGLNFDGPEEFGYGLGGFVVVGSVKGSDGSWLGHDSFSGYEPVTGTMISVYENSQTGAPHVLQSLSTITYEIMEYLLPGCMKNPGYMTGEPISGAAAASMLPMTSAASGNVYLPGEFQPFVEINQAKTNAPVPVNASGCYVTALGAGGHGGPGSAGAYNVTGGAGGGGGGRINRIRIPRSQLGDTYSTAFGAGQDSVFSSGSLNLTARAGAAGASANGNYGATAPGGAGGTWTATPATIDGVAVTGANGSPGANSTMSGGGAGNANANDAGPGGAGGRGSYGGISGGVQPGAASSTVPASAVGQPGGDAADPAASTPPAAHAGASGGEGAAGGKYAAGGGGGYSSVSYGAQAGGPGGIGLLIVEWF